MKLTELRQRQRERTNRSGLDDYPAEVDVPAVYAERHLPSLLIASRDGSVEVQLIRDAKQAIG